MLGGWDGCSKGRQCFALNVIIALEDGYTQVEGSVVFVKVQIVDTKYHALVR